MYIADNRYEAFAREGWDMSAYTPFPSRGLTKEEIRKWRKIPMEMLYEGKMIVRRFSLSNEGHSTIKRVLRYFIQNIKQYRWAINKKNIKDVDAIFVASTPPLHGYMVSCVAKKHGIPFVYNVQDVFPDSLVGTGLAQKGSLLWKLGNKIENMTYARASKIIVISEDFRNNLISKGVSEEKIEVIYNWVDEEAVVNVPRLKNKLFAKYNLNPSKFYITYSGNIGMTQNMDMLLSVMEELQTKAPDVELILIGEGAYKAQVERVVKEKKFMNVTLLPFQPYEDISHVFSLGDVGLVISKPGVGANSVPSKTWSIMSASRPVLANFDENELKTIIEENNCGIFTKAGDKVAFTDAILKLYHDRELCKVMGSNGRKFVMDNLTKEVGTQKYVDVIKSFEK